MATTSKKVWNTAFTNDFQCRLPIISAPMAGVSGGLLASQVCNAGGLGMIAAGHFQDVNGLEREIQIFLDNARNDAAEDEINTMLHSELSNLQRPGLSIGFIGHSSLATNMGWENYEYILQKHQPSAVQFFAPSIITRKGIETAEGESSMTNVQLAHKYGAKFIAQVGSIEEAKDAIDHKVNAIICQGSEAGGHGIRRELGNSTMALASQVSTMTDIPVLAAGGIVSGRHVAAALCICDGAVMGTRFWASLESIGNKTLQRELIKENSCDDVIRTTVFDQIENELKSCKWPYPYDSVGALRNKTTHEWEGRSSQLQEAIVGTTLLERYKMSSESSDSNFTSILAGEGVGEIKTIEGAFDMLLTVEEEALAIIDRLKSI